MFEKRLTDIASRDAQSLVRAEESYGSSWRKRGGVGAFMMLARKWDRIETALQPDPTAPERAQGSGEERPVAPWDVFGAFEADRREEGILDDIRDLRRYLMLVEEYLTRETQPQRTEPEFRRPSLSEVRWPINMTDFEYGNMGPSPIKYGSMSGRKVSELYEPSKSGTVHPWSMKEEFHREYGR